MAGSDGNRGYLIQTLIALITSLDDMSWDSVSIEPDHESEKIDILWEGEKRIACQVKSSINQINKHHAKKWAKELEDDVEADIYQLALVGPCAQSVVQLENVGAVLVPTPKNNDLSSLISLAAHLLDKNVLTKELGNIGPVKRELIAHALVGKLSAYASSGEFLTRSKFIGLIVEWAKSVASSANEQWQLISFESQRGLENAIAGKKLGPSDVKTCPRFEECNYIYAQIDRSHTFSIVGQPGTGKSISAWQVAYQFHQLGFNIFRPYLSEDTRSLLESIPKDKKCLLVIDDSQVFDPKFVEQLVEISNNSLKVIFTSSHPMEIGRDMNTVLGKANLKYLENELLARRDEVLDAVRKFDERIGDGFSDESLERRLSFCSKQDTPWQFFWLLRGGWKTARAELRSVSELPNAKTILIIISSYQIASCDSGITHSQLCELASKTNIEISAIERAIEALLGFNQIEFERGILRTKHFQFAHEVIEIATEAHSVEKWDMDIDLLETIFTMPVINPQGVYGLLKAIKPIVLRKNDQLRFEAVFHIVETRFAGSWGVDDWVSGCMHLLYQLCEFSNDRILKDKNKLLVILQGKSKRDAFFGHNLANTLINGSGKVEANRDKVKELFNKIDSKSLADNLNKRELNEFALFGELLDRISFFDPTWKITFTKHVDWNRIVRIINNGAATDASSVDDLVVPLSRLATDTKDLYSHQHVIDILPFIDNAMADNPWDTYARLRAIYWSILGHAPKYMRHSQPNQLQIELATRTLQNVDTAKVAKITPTLLTRDYEHLSRLLSILRELKPQKYDNYVSCLNKSALLADTQKEWKEQSSDFLSFLTALCSQKEHMDMVADWVSEAEGVIEGPLSLELTAIAPKSAMNFHKSGKGITLLEWTGSINQFTNLAIYSIGCADEECCLDILTAHTDKLALAVCKICLEPRDLLRFFRLIYTLSPELFKTLVNKIDISSPDAKQSFRQIYDRKDLRTSYLKLARLATWTGGDIGILGANFISKINDQN